MIGARAVIRTFLLLALIAGPVRSADRPIGFLTPSKNIVCQLFTDNGQGVLRCDIMVVDTLPRRPADASWTGATPTR
jgi:hypothetical protein